MIIMNTIIFAGIIIVTFGAANAAILSWNEFQNAVRQYGPSPRQDQYNAFTHRITSAGGITTKVEAAIFLTQVLWESGGLKYKRELACIQTGCPGVYDHSVGVPGKNYYGRGYIQLTHSYNYKAASYDLFHDDRLIKHPELVSDNEDIAWATAFWYWHKFVHNAPGVQQGHFGAATNAVNGALECRGPNKAVAHKRFDLYKRVLNAVGLKASQANEHGCYN